MQVHQMKARTLQNDWMAAEDSSAQHPSKAMPPRASAQLHGSSHEAACSAISAASHQTKPQAAVLALPRQPTPQLPAPQQFAIDFPQQAALHSHQQWALEQQNVQLLLEQMPRPVSRLLARLGFHQLKLRQQLPREPRLHWLWVRQWVMPPQLPPQQAPLELALIRNPEALPEAGQHQAAPDPPLGVRLHRSPNLATARTPLRLPRICIPLPAPQHFQLGAAVVEMPQDPHLTSLASR
mmetsp:Transcript_118746/g.221991  ORF Transcript_118746/g.221991 Transcript_118746/m.221991 type:complete len:238 (-) Transcript_118746:320-1033(-)